MPKATIFIILIICMAWSTCHKSNVAHSPIQREIARGSTEADAALLQPDVKSAIRSVDFANFTYVLSAARPNEAETFTLRGGKATTHRTSEEVKLSYLAYGDVTSDGVEEAFIVLGLNSRGTVVTCLIYIYALKSGNPNLLWSFQSGDRGAGGLRQITAENGNLLLELYGKDKVIGSNLYGLETGVCCPKEYTRTIYQWQKKEFVLQGMTILPNDQLGAPVLMPRYVSLN